MKNLKKLAMILMSMLLVFALIGCGDDKAPEQPAETPAAEQPAEAPAEENAEAPADEAAEAPAEDAAVMSYDEFVAAELDSEVTVETYVQAKQSWWEKDGQGVATLYTQNEDGAYFLYNAACSQEDYDKLEVGTKIRVHGFKTEWSGEVEIVDATIEIIDGNYVAEPADLTENFGSEDLVNYQNQFVSFKGLTVADKGEGAAFTYSYDGSGTDGDDLYFDVTLGDKTVTFVVESYLCDKDSDVYNAVKNLKVGDTIDVEGFMYWYEGPQLHTTSVTVK